MLLTVVMVLPGVRLRLAVALAVMSGNSCERTMSRFASACSTFAIATAMSRLSVCAVVTRPLSSMLPKLFHQSGLGQMEAPGARGPWNAGGTSCGFRACGTGVEHAAAAKVTAAIATNRTHPFMNEAPLFRESAQ